MTQSVSEPRPCDHDIIACAAAAAPAGTWGVLLIDWPQVFGVAADWSDADSRIFTYRMTDTRPDNLRGRWEAINFSVADYSGQMRPAFADEIERQLSVLSNRMERPQALDVADALADVGVPFQATRR